MKTGEVQLGDFMEAFRIRAEETGRTKRWDIRNKRSGGRLGRVKWYGPWRQYCFFPAGECVFNAGCLDEIYQFLKGEMASHGT